MHLTHSELVGGERRRSHCAERLKATIMFGSSTRAIGPRSYWSLRTAARRIRRPMNGATHQPFRDPKSVQRLSQTFAQSLSALDLAEPLHSLDENQPMRMAQDLMRKR